MSGDELDGLFDAAQFITRPEAEALWAQTKAAIDQAEKGADALWLQQAKRIVWRLAQSGEEWTTDQVWYRLEATGLVTSEPRALGAVVRAAARAGFITQAGYRPTSRPEAHSRPIPIWKGTAKCREAA